MAKSIPATKMVAKKPVAKTKSSPDFLEKVTTVKVNWKKVPNGTYVSVGVGSKRTISGFFYREEPSADEFFILHDNYNNAGNSPKYMSTSTFKYGWVILDDDTELLEDVEFPPILFDRKTMRLPKKPTNVIRIGDYDATVTNASIKVGCTTVPRKKVEAVLKLMQSLDK